MTGAKVSDSTLPQQKDAIPREPLVYIYKANRQLLSKQWSIDDNQNIILKIIKSCLILSSFQWTSWGNNTKDVKAQSIQEVTNFGILSALSLALNISIAVTVDGNDNWPEDSTWRQALGVIFNTASSSMVISLLSSAFLLLIINETPEGRAVVLVIEHIGMWIRLPGISFMIGVYGFCGLMCCWLMHAFSLWISVTVCGIFVIIASVSIFGAVSTGIQGLYKVMSDFATLKIVNDVAIMKLIDLYLEASHCLHPHGCVIGFKREDFYDWILQQYECCDFCDLSKRRLDRFIDNWEGKEIEV